MTIVVLSIADVSMNKIRLWKNVRVDEWRAERAIIASNVREFKLHCREELRDSPVAEHRHSVCNNVFA